MILSNLVIYVRENILYTATIRGKMLPRFPSKPIRTGSMVGQHM